MQKNTPRGFTALARLSLFARQNKTTQANK